MGTDPNTQKHMSRNPQRVFDKKYMPPFMHEEAAAVVGGEPILQELLRAGWLAPLRVTPIGVTLYDCTATYAAWNRIVSEGYDALQTAAANAPAPSRKPRRPKALSTCP